MGRWQNAVAIFLYTPSDKKFEDKTYPRIEILGVKQFFGNFS